MKTRKDSELAVAVIREIINEWDPDCLLDGDAPTDEFDSEITQLVTYIPRIRTVDDAVHAVSEVFSRMFEPDLFRPESCSDVGLRLYDALLRHGWCAQGSWITSGW